MTEPSSTGSREEGAAEIRRSVLAYLHACPQAADTPRGIVNWWLPRQRYETSRQRIAAIVEGMVCDGVLYRGQLPEGRSCTR